jgi:hypothetical protein
VLVLCALDCMIKKKLLVKPKPDIGYFMHLIGFEVCCASLRIIFHKKMLFPMSCRPLFKIDFFLSLQNNY